MKKIRVSALFLFTFVLVFGISVNASLHASEPIVIKFATDVYVKMLPGQVVDQFAKIANQRLKGKVKIEVYPAGQLLKSKELVEGVRKNIIQMTLGVSARYSTLSKKLEIFDLPFLFPNYETTYKIIDRKDFKRVCFSELETKGLKIVGIFDAGKNCFTNNKRVIRTPSDFNGLKMRSFNRVCSAFLKEVGAQVVSISALEMNAALRQGMMDGISTSTEGVYGRKLYEIQDYVTVADFSMIPFLISVNQKFWANLPPDIRSQLEDIVKDVCVAGRTRLRQREDNIIYPALREHLKNLHFLTAKEAVEWKKEAVKVYPLFVKGIGEDLFRFTEKLIKETKQ